MNAATRRVQGTYLLLHFLQTLAASFIWGINTIFLLNAGLSNTEAFAANAFFTAGLVLFEIPTGVVADTLGRRLSYLLGTLTLAVSTLLYVLLWYWAAPFWTWALASVLLGLGFTFFSGAVEAWLVDALTFSGFFREQGRLESVLAKGQVVAGVAMLGGTVAGGAIAQATNLGVPYLVRAGVLLLDFAVALILLRDIGFTPSASKSLVVEVRAIVRASLRYGLGNPPARWLMLASPFSAGVSIYGFYAMQPYLLELHGDRAAYGVAGLSAAIVAAAQIAGGLLVPHMARLFRRRSSLLLLGALVTSMLLFALGFRASFATAIVLLVSWGLVFAAITPVRQALLNGLIPSQQRATVLSFDSLLGSSGGVGIQPVLGRVADLSGYPASYVVGAAFQLLALPLLWLARRERPASDIIAETLPLPPQKM